MNIPRISIYISIGIISVLVALHVFGARNMSGGTETRISASALSFDDGNTFTALALEARSAYVFDLAKQEIIFSREPDRVLPLASLAKLMIALLAREMLNDDDAVTVNDEAVRMDGDDGFLVGERFTVSVLRDAMLIASSNDAAYALAAALATQDRQTNHDGVIRAVLLMNEAARRMGLAHTVFFNTTGLDLDQTAAGALGTAREIAILAQHILERYPALLSATRQASLELPSLSGVTHIWKNTNKAFDRISGLIATKTGFTDLAGGNLLVVFDVGVHRPMIAVILGSSFEGRFSDMEQIIQATYQYVQ